MQSVAHQIANVYHVAGIEKAAKTNPVYRILAANATSGEMVAESAFDRTVRLVIEDRYGNKVDTFNIPGKTIPGSRYVLCRNPYPTTPFDKWLLADTDGTAFFCATTWVLCRLYLRTIKNEIKTAA